MKGFTLVELLVTVAIVGLLATLSMAIFQEYRDKAHLATLKLVAHDVRVAGLTLVQDLDLTNSLAEYHAYNSDDASATYTTLVNHLTGNQVLADFIPGHIANSDQYRVSIYLRRWATGEYRVFAGAHHCKTSPGAINLYIHIVNYDAGDTNPTITLREEYDTRWGVGGTYCP